MSSPLRKEVREYVSACESLLTVILYADSEPLTDEEQHVIKYYRDELAYYVGEEKRMRPIQPVT